MDQQLCFRKLGRFDSFLKTTAGITQDLKQVDVVILVPCIHTLKETILITQACAHLRFARGLAIRMLKKVKKKPKLN